MSQASEQELRSLEAVIKNIQDYPYRIKTKDGKPGGLIELPETIVPIVVGDLHTALDNLKAILKHDDNHAKVRSGERTLVFIGDIIHSDQTGFMKDMTSSVEIFTYIIEIMAERPKGFIYLKGNHDTFDDRLVKSGILQGKEFRKTLIEQKGQAYTEAVEQLFDTLPLFIKGNGFIITHAGPIRGGSTRDELINIRDYPDKLHQLLWNRAHEFRGTPSPKEYDGKDIDATLAKLGMKDDTLFIVGHNPLWGTGEKTGIWMNVTDILNHHIIVSSPGTLAPYFLIQDQKLEARFANGIQKEERYHYGE